MSERYCLRCGKVVLDPNVNYGINPDVVCECPPEQAILDEPHGAQPADFSHAVQERLFA